MPKRSSGGATASMRAAQTNRAPATGCPVLGQTPDDGTLRLQLVANGLLHRGDALAAVLEAGEFPHFLTQDARLADVWAKRRDVTGALTSRPKPEVVVRGTI